MRVAQMEWIFWYLNLAADSVYLIAPLGFALWLVYRLIGLVVPRSKYLALPFVLIGLIGAYAITAFPGYNYQIEKQKQAVDLPHVIAHVPSTRTQLYNPITWIWPQPTSFIFVMPTEADYMMGTTDYMFGGNENTFRLNISYFDYDSNVEQENYYEYTANCSEKRHSILGAAEDGVMRWLVDNEPMGAADYKRYCETDYTSQFEILQCMRKVLESGSEEVTETAIIQAGQKCQY